MLKEEMCTYVAYTVRKAILLGYTNLWVGHDSKERGDRSMSLYSCHAGRTVLVDFWYTGNSSSDGDEGNEIIVAYSTIGDEREIETDGLCLTSRPVNTYEWLDKILDRGSDFMFENNTK